MSLDTGTVGYWGGTQNGAHSHRPLLGFGGIEEDGHGPASAAAIPY